MGTTLLIIAYALIWLGLLAYVGWLALRMRGVRAEVEAARELLERRTSETERQAKRLS
jgi:CcmD family protein